MFNKMIFHYNSDKEIEFADSGGDSGEGGRHFLILCCKNMILAVLPKNDKISLKFTVLSAF